MRREGKRGISPLSSLGLNVKICKMWMIRAPLSPWCEKATKLRTHQITGLSNPTVLSEPMDGKSISHGKCPPYSHGIKKFSFVYSQVFPFLLCLLRCPPASVLSSPGRSPLGCGKTERGEMLRGPGGPPGGPGQALAKTGSKGTERDQGSGWSAEKQADRHLETHGCGF